MRKVLLAATALIALGLAYLLLWPVPVDPSPWIAEKAPGYVGPHARNERLAALQVIDMGGDLGPEHVVVRDGWVYVAVLRGAIVRMRPDGSERHFNFLHEADWSDVYVYPQSSFKMTPGVWKVTILDGSRELVHGQVQVTP